MTIIIRAPHEVRDMDKATKMVDDIRAGWIPVVTVVRTGYDYFVALEGSHRLWACAQAGIMPNLIVYGHDEVKDMMVSDLVGDQAVEDYTVEEWCGPAYYPEEYSFDGGICDVNN